LALADRSGRWVGPAHFGACFVGCEHPFDARACGRYERVGDVLVAQGKLDEALKAYRDGLAIRERLAAAVGASLRSPTSPDGGGITYSAGCVERRGACANERAPATAAKLASSTITSRPAEMRSCPPECSVLWPEPVSTGRIFPFPRLSLSVSFSILNGSRRACPRTPSVL
jgi:hypothetical protein